MRNVLGAASCVLLFVTGTSSAFELRTHSRITETAIQRSVLAKDAKSISGRLGIDITDVTTLSAGYFDVSGTNVITPTRDSSRPIPTSTARPLPRSIRCRATTEASTRQLPISIAPRAVRPCPFDISAGGSSIRNRA